MSLNGVDVLGSWDRVSQFGRAIDSELVDVMEGVELVSDALSRMYPNSNLDKFADGMCMAGNATAVASLLSDATKLTAGSMSCYEEAKENGVVSSEFGRSVVDLSVDAAWTGVHAGKAAKFASSVEVIDVPNVSAQKVIDWCNLYASAVGLYDNICTMLVGKQSSVNETEQKVYECQWWQNNFEFGLNLTSLLMAVVGVASIAICNYTLFALSSTYLVCVIASHILEEESKQLVVGQFANVNLYT